MPVVQNICWKKQKMDGRLGFDDTNIFTLYSVLNLRDERAYLGLSFARILLALQMIISFDTDGWMGFNGILNMQVVAISCLSLLVRPLACVKEIIHLG